MRERQEVCGALALRARGEVLCCDEVQCTSDVERVDVGHKMLWWGLRTWADIVSPSLALRLARGMDAPALHQGQGYGFRRTLS